MKTAFSKIFHFILKFWRTVIFCTFCKHKDNCSFHADKQQNSDKKED